MQLHELPEIWVVCALSRPSMAAFVFGQFELQTYPRKRLAIVEDREAVGLCKRIGLWPDLLLRSEAPGQASARNTALKVLKSMPLPSETWWSNWDDDDERGQGYLAEVAMNANKHDVLGKRDVFVRLSNRTLLRFVRCGSAICGATISARVECSPMFRNPGQWGEDELWLDQVKSKGLSVGKLSSWHFVLNRSGNDHAWPLTDKCFVDIFRSGKTGSRVESYGTVSSSFVHHMAKRQHGAYDRSEIDWDAVLCELRTSQGDTQETVQ